MQFQEWDQRPDLYGIRRSGRSRKEVVRYAPTQVQEYKLKNIFSFYLFIILGKFTSKCSTLTQVEYIPCVFLTVTIAKELIFFNSSEIMLEILPRC